MRSQNVCSILVFALVFCLTACGTKDPPKPDPNGATAVANNVAEVIGVETREDKIPNFSWRDSEGKITALDSYRGKVTLVNFWATWCGPCKRELPDLIDLSSELSDRGIRIIGVSTDRGSNAIEDVRTFVKEHHIPYQVVVSNEDLESAFHNVNFLPTSFIVDANGKIVQTYIGPRSKSFFSDALLAALK